MRRMWALQVVLVVSLVAAAAVGAQVDLSRELVAEVRELEYFPVTGDEIWYGPDFLAPRGGGTRQ
ncbi:MAG: hypothetical protein AAGA17_19045, partial [Actinomycetota bacterium]